MQIKKIGKIPTDEDLKAYLEQRIIPVRFCYAGEGGNIWHELRRDESFKIGEREFVAYLRGLEDIRHSLTSSRYEDELEEDYRHLIEALREFNIEKYREISKQIDKKEAKRIWDNPVNLIHLGPGDGIEIRPLIKILGIDERNTYSGVDISEQMIQNTSKLNKTHLSKINTSWYLTDIETEGNLELICEDVKNKNANRNLILLNNQGVLLSNPKMLEFLHNSMYRDKESDWSPKDDYAFITLECYEKDKEEEICLTYDLPGVRALLSVGLKRTGYNPKKGKFRTIFNRKKSQVEVYFKPKNEKEILCLTSYKPESSEFLDRLMESGFITHFLSYNQENHSLALLIKKANKYGE